jgi:hypothetical protein
MSQAPQLDDTWNNTSGREPPAPAVRSSSGSLIVLNLIPATEVNITFRKLGCGEPEPMGYSQDT